jgi:Aspartate ammonia-lyase
MHNEMIKSLAQVKKAAAISNLEAKALDETVAVAIIKASDEIIGGKHHEQFIVDAIQGGAGTSANMNANEVIANRAIELLGGKRGDYSIVHPNNHVNMGQSTNDVYPTAGKLTLIKLIEPAIAELERLSEALREKASEFDDVIKIGRTQLQEAVPIRLGQEFGAYRSAVLRDLSRIKKAAEKLKSINLGGTAIGTCVNADAYYVENVVAALSKVTGFDLIQSDDLIDSTQNADVYVELSSALKICAVNLSKLSNDLRLMSSGPNAGFGDILLPAKQNGSSIMPGKINPVIPEVMNQVAFNIIGNDMTVTLAAEAGQLELNAFEPVIFFKLFESLTTLASGVKTLTNNCIKGIKPNRERCSEMVEKSCGIATAAAPYIGYKEAANIAKLSIKTGEPVKEILLHKGLFKPKDIERIFDLRRMTQAARR